MICTSLQIYFMIIKLIFYTKGFTQRLVLKQRHKDTFIHELLTGAFDLQQIRWIMYRGWPETWSEVPQCLYSFFDMRYFLTVQRLVDLPLYKRSRGTQITYRYWRVYTNSTWYLLSASHGNRATRIHLRMYCMPGPLHLASHGTTPTTLSGGLTVVQSSCWSLGAKQRHTTSHLRLLQ